MSDHNSYMIADMSDDDKPREKARRHGIKSLSNTELLAIILSGGTQGKSVIDLSREVLRKCDNSLVKLAKMSISDLCRQFNGIGPVKAITIEAAFELGARCRDENPDNSLIVRSSRDAYNYIRSSLENLPHEEFWVLMLSRSNRILCAERISQGGTTATYVEPKMVVRKALDHMASAIILAHNHPSGNLNPSRDDDNLTQRIRKAAELLDIRVLDHLIIGENTYHSYSDHGTL